MNMMEIDGFKAKIEYDPNLDQFRGEFLGLNGSADFYGKTPVTLRKEFKNSLKVLIQSKIIQVNLMVNRFKTRR